MKVVSKLGKVTSKPKFLLLYIEVKSLNMRVKMKMPAKKMKKKAGFGCSENLAKGVPFNSCVGRGRGDQSEG